LKSATTVVLSVVVAAALMWSVMIANWVILLMCESRRKYVRHASWETGHWTCA
jgi:hypothetical protein